jgi:flagellar basal body-associated protein FliL
MHQMINTPGAATAPPKKRKSRRTRYIVIGVVLLLVGWLITSIVLGKREKPLPVTTEKANPQDNHQDRLCDW